MSTLGRGWRPDRTADSVYDVDLDTLHALGVRTLCLDIDNTLVGWNEPASTRAIRWLAGVQQRGFSVVFVSNNTHARVAAFRRGLAAGGGPELPGIAAANKPRRSGYRRALQLVGGDPRHTAVVGDQLWTDVWGGNRTGCFTVLVAPLDRREFFGTRVARSLQSLWLRAGLRLQPPASINRSAPSSASAT